MEMSDIKDKKEAKVCVKGIPRRGYDLNSVKPGFVPKNRAETRAYNKAVKKGLVEFSNANS